MVKDFYLSTIDKVHFFYTTLITNYGLSRILNSTIQSNNELVDKSLLALLKEVIKIFFKLFELIGRQNQFRLHFWSNLLKEREFFDDEIVVI